jgi:hypothetical protein
LEAEGVVSGEERSRSSSIRRGEKQKEQYQERREAEVAVAGKERSRRSSIRKGEKQ